MPIDDGVIVIHVDALPPETEKPVPPQIPQSEQAPVKQHTFIDNITIVQKDIGSEVSPITDLLNAAVSNSTTDGKNADVMQPLPPVERSSIGSAEKAAEEKPPTEVIPDKQPQFPGGIQAWQAFLSKHLHAPQDLEEGEKRTVLIRFHVAADGSIADFQVLQSAGSVFDNEVIRVLKKMPKWTPASKAGQPVSVSFTQPVTFVGIEE
jgi:protein TonB